MKLKGINKPENKITINKNGYIEVEWNNDIKLQIYILAVIDYAYYFYYIAENIEGA